MNAWNTRLNSYHVANAIVCALLVGSPQLQAAEHVVQIRDAAQAPRTVGHAMELTVEAPDAAGDPHDDVIADEKGRTVRRERRVIINSGQAGDERGRVIINSLEPGDELAPNPDRTWMGISTEESPEVVAAQLNLTPGVGLVVSYVSSNSPAVAAGLQKNDLLMELDKQALVHPAQLRKLVQMHKEGDTIEVVLYRGGKKQTATVTLAKAPPGLSRAELDGAALGLLRRRELPMGDALRERMATLKESLGNLHLDEKVQQEVQRSLDETRRAVRRALREATNGLANLGPAKKMIEDFTRSGMAVDHNASVTVRSTAKNARSVVQTDDFGTVVIVKNPRLHLTAHDSEGNLLFDGEIDTPEHRAQVPKDLLERTKPLLRQLEGAPPAAEDGEETAPAEKTK